MNNISGILERLIQSINAQIELSPEWQPILKSNKASLSSNVADGVVIDESVAIPAGHRFVVEDFNINFTTAAGTVRIVILDAAGNEVIDVLRDITSSVNGTGKTVLEQGERLAVLGQVAGAGTFGVYVSGFLQKTRSTM